jgi:hypothetical protein
MRRDTGPAFQSWDAYNVEMKEGALENLAALSEETRRRLWSRLTELASSTAVRDPGQLPNREVACFSFGAWLFTCELNHLTRTITLVEAKKLVE